MVLRMFETGVSTYSVDSTGEVLAAEGVGEATAAVAGLYFSTSSRMIRPEGPVPLIFDRGMPCSRAIFLAIGEAKMR